ncbi:hypothetical protein JHK85_042958 [Glycine max]|nr:hypothetical protein JHK85_042958 [Glycine max]
MDLLEPEQEAAKGSKSNSYNRYGSGSQNGSTVAIIQTTITGMTIHTTTMDALFITMVLSMVINGNEGYIEGGSHFTTRYYYGEPIKEVIVVREGTQEGFVINQIHHIHHRQPDLLCMMLLHLHETRCRPNLLWAWCPSTFMSLYGSNVTPPS